MADAQAVRRERSTNDDGPHDDEFVDVLVDEVDEVDEHIGQPSDLEVAPVEDDDLDVDPLEVELEDDRTPAPVGWSSPARDVIPRESGNRRFYVGIALIVVATAIGVLFALGLDSGDGGEGSEPATSIPLEVRGATTIRPGGLSPVCQAELARVQQAEENYQRGSVNGQYTDMEGLVDSGKLAAQSTLFVLVNEVAGTPSVVSFAGTSAREFEDFLVVPIPDGPCDTT